MKNGRTMDDSFSLSPVSCGAVRRGAVSGRADVSVGDVRSKVAGIARLDTVVLLKEHDNDYQTVAISSRLVSSRPFPRDVCRP